MNNQINPQPAKKLALTKTTLHLLIAPSTNRLDAPTEGCTPTCGSGLCFVANAQAPVAQNAVQESK